MTDARLQREWTPTKIVRFERSVRSSTNVAIVMTDAGRAYAKVMGNPVGQHALACELVTTQIALWLGLTTFDFAIVDLSKDLVPDFAGGNAVPGPAFVTRAIARAEEFDGGPKQLKRIENDHDIVRLIVLDTLVRNPDRYPGQPPDPACGFTKANRDNVFLGRSGSTPSGLRLYAMDFSHAFTRGRDITKRAFTIAEEKDERVYGMFPEFDATVKKSRSVVAATVADLRKMTQGHVSGWLDRIPAAWDVSPAGRQAFASFIYDRAHFVADRIDRLLFPDELPFEE